MTAASSWDEANIGIAAAVRAIDARNDQRQSLRDHNARLQRQVEHFNRTHGDCGAVIHDLREDLAAALCRIQELEGVEQYHGKAVES